MPGLSADPALKPRPCNNPSNESQSPSSIAEAAFLPRFRPVGPASPFNSRAQYIRDMRRITSSSHEPLFDTVATRRIENRAQANLPPHALMDRAGLAVARLACALAPHARTIWIACGPGNNGGDGLRAAAHLAQWRREGRGGWQVHVTHAHGTAPDPDRLPDDARHALACALAAGVRLQADAPPRADLAIDALLGIGARHGPEGVMGQWQ